MPIKNIYICKDEKNYFVDAQCTEQHFGQKCSCKNIATVKNEKLALFIGKVNARILNVPLLTNF